MGTKMEPGQFDCYAAAADNEPLFVLRANDPLAPDIVDAWADRYSLANADSPSEKVLAKVREARACARDMRRWLAFPECRK